MCSGLHIVQAPCGSRQASHDTYRERDEDGRDPDKACRQIVVSKDMPTDALLVYRFSQRMTPVSGSCVANLSEIQSLCSRIVKAALAAEPDKKFTVR